MKIICYGDSNTWGFNPHSGNRFDEKTRWPAVMSSCLGDEDEVVEEGLNGRTIGNHLPRGSPLNGLEYLEHILNKYPRFDMFILYLGINDLFQRDDIGPEEIAEKIGRALELIHSTVLLLSPLPMNVSEELSETYRLLTIKAEYFHTEYERIARKYKAELINTGEIISASPVDGVHIEAEEHRKLGRHLCEVVEGLL